MESSSSGRILIHVQSSMIKLQLRLFKEEFEARRHVRLVSHVTACHAISSNISEQIMQATEKKQKPLMNRAAAPVTHSWARIVSQSPKKAMPVPVPKDIPDVPSLSKERPKNRIKTQVERPITTTDADQEGLSEKKKKKRKKKKKSKQPENDGKTEEAIVIQEPPKFEDFEEFPDLSSASTNLSRANKCLFSSNLIPMHQAEATVDKDSGTLLNQTNLSSGDANTVNPQRAKNSASVFAQDSSVTTAETKKSQESSKKSGKKSVAPVQLSLGDMLAALEQKQQVQKSKQTAKPIVLSVGGARPVIPKEPAVPKKQASQGMVPHNPLDSSAPLIKKGKQREVPKPKKPSQLKKIILKEREERKQKRLLAEKRVPLSDSENINLNSQQEQRKSSEDTVSAEDSSIKDTTLSENTDETSLDQNCIESHVSDVDSPSDEIVCHNLPKIHSRRFREYCNQVLSKDIDTCVTELLKELVRFQDRLYQKDPVKAKTKRRIVMGLREVLKHLKLRKLKCVIISPNCEKIQSKGGLDEALRIIIDTACEQNIPFIFALNRKFLGHCVKKAVPVTVVGIFSYDGAENYFHKMVELTTDARKAYEDMIASSEQQDDQTEDTKEPVESLSRQSEDTAVSSSTIISRSYAEPDEPEYMKIWKRMLEKEYSSFSFRMSETP
ncbi:selenocysteine insertion sequence-binding protein 2 [Protopterus annectens]|uniref:selenocysteine insertion sequence-binding protein 2 n=1 Tax=Protopterus annectens TaxID=7888 RepID=UPI001CF938B6|nr:selenocysteine insertion sequence-binding protein 2 [Protopterus annectens]